MPYKDPERRREYGREWIRQNAEKARAFTSEEWLAVLLAYARRCAYCGAEGLLHADHRIPLSRGGTNYISNILPACPPCNQRKHRLTDEEYRRRRRDEGC